MRKMIFTCMLAIVSSVWMTSEALCLAPVPDAMYEPYATVSGTFVSVPIPCEPSDEYPCPACLTLALQTSDRLYYLTANNADIQTQLENIEYLLSEAADITGTVSGTPYTEDNYEYIKVSELQTGDTKLPSLCDEWNVLEHLTALGPDYESFGTLHFRLTSDTMINEMRYVRLEQDGTYKGALREGTNADIYYVPNNSTHEYLLYAFHAQVGDNLENLWFGANEIDRYIINSATVVSIESTTPRKFTIGFEWQSIYSYAAINDTSEIMYAELVWLEGLGFQSGGPLSYKCPFDCVGGPGLLTLCAYKNGEQVYADPYWSEKIGCEYNRHTLYYLCDEWNVLYEPFSWPGGYNTFKYYLSTDTIINGQQYVKLASDKDYPYCGAMREDNNANIYYIPSGSTHEYLLYAFNAQTGDTLSNLWVGGFGEGYQGVVQAISKGSPRIFTIGVKFDFEYFNPDSFYPIQWIEGIGTPETPMGIAVVPTVPADIGVFNLLCAYKNGQQVYATQLSERYGCFYEGRSAPPTADTIPMFFYTGDDPGSSTVDPVDPNQVIVTLKGDQLTVKEFSGEEIGLELTVNSAALPARHRVMETQTFRNEISVTLTNEGSYTLLLSSAAWDYGIYGTFDYPQRHDATDQTTAPASAAQKVLINGQLFIRKGGKTYTIQGTEIR